MQENNDKESNERESTEEEEETIFVRVPDNPSVSLIDVGGEVFAAEDCGGYALEQWARDLPRNRSVESNLALFIDDDKFTIEVAGGIGISVPLSMVEELILAYRAEIRARIHAIS